jgi:hypothetical protein
MIAKIKRTLLTIAALFTLSAPALIPVAVHAQVTNPSITGGLQCGSNLELNTSGSQQCDVDSASGTSLTSLIRKIINIFSVIIGVIAVIMIIIGGLKYITSGGESSNVSGAKNTIIYAIVGLIVVALAQFIVHFVLANTANL